MKGGFELDSKAIKDFIIANNIGERTIKGFWKCFDNYKKEEVEEFSQVFGDFDNERLTIWMDKVNQSIRNWDKFDNEYNENHEYIEAFIKLEYKGKYIGWYSLLFNFDGKTFDDYFVLV